MSGPQYTFDPQLLAGLREGFVPHQNQLRLRLLFGLITGFRRDLGGFTGRSTGMEDVGGASLGTWDDVN